MIRNSISDAEGGEERERKVRVFGGMMRETLRREGCRRREFKEEEQQSEWKTEDEDR